MSKSHPARRIALLSSSSLGLAAIASAASLGAALTPAIAIAQTVICAPPPASGNGTADAVYAAGTYNPGITCVYTGDGAEVSTTGPISVGTVAGGDGINLSATGTDDITWDSQAGTPPTAPFTSANTDGQITGGNFTNGPVIDATTQDGDIIIRADRINGSANSGTFATNSTHAIRAIASGAGDITIEAELANGGGTAGAAPPGVAGIEARSLGGGDVTVSTTSQASGRLYGIVAQATGAGALTVNNASGANITASSTATSVAMDLTAGTGKITVNATAPGNRIITTNGTALRASYGGDAEFNLYNVIANGLTTGTTWNTDLFTTPGTTTTINLAGTMGTDAIGNNANPDRRTLRFAGGGDLNFNITGILAGIVDLPGAGDVNMSLKSGGIWRLSSSASSSFFGGGDDTVSVDAGGTLYVGSIGPIVLDFGAGDDRYVNNGLLMTSTNNNTLSAQSGVSTASGEFRLLNLEAFDNAGVIYLGGRQFFPDTGSEGLPDDILYMSGTTFTGLDGSLILMDVLLTGNQPACDASLRDPATDDLPGADCVRIENGATAGVTQLLLKEQVAGDRGAYGTEIVLIDTAGSDSAAGHFVLHPDSPNYNPLNGGFIDKGFFIYPLVYDAGTGQHKLVATTGQDALQFPLVAQAAHELWRLSTGTWLDRQADLRGGIDDSMGGVWMRLGTEFADRDLTQVVDVVGNPFAFDNSYVQNSYAVTGGLDVVTGRTGDSAWGAGLTAGYVHGDMTFDASANSMDLDGWTGGVYASFISGGLFVDATVTGNKLELEGDVPALNLIPTGTLIATNLLSVGGQVEAGWRFPIMETAFIEPLAGVTYVRTKYDNLDIASDDPLREGVEVEFDDPTSLRASLGARLGLDQDYGVVRAQYSLLGRVWNEFEDETRIVAHNIGDDAVLLDEFTGTFSEFGVGVSVFGLDDALSGFLDFGGKFGDDYQSQNLSAGVRVNW